MSITENEANYYVKLGAKREREYIVKALKKEISNCEKAGLWANSPELRENLQELHLGLTAAVAFIEKDLDGEQLG